MNHVFRYFTLNRIGTALFLISLYLLFGSIIEFLARSTSRGPTVRFSGLNESE
jgi:hypothetical protein